MYDSRSSHPRNQGNRRQRWIGEEPFTSTLPKEQDIREGILAAVEADEVAGTRNHEMWGVDINRLHGEALGYNELASWERELLFGDAVVAEASWSSEEQDWINAEMDRLDREERLEREAQYDDEYGGYSDEHWMPLATIEECREFFGGTDFIILHTNVLRRTA